ncbi:MAG TPA: hypothetical protein VHX68_16360 [Planctomycetaceae bacterium]|jgi:hypothetical protein|nr:hypothetical protein [Planctomycetaceae bacterium]
MSNISCTEFNRLLEESIEAHSPLDTPELRGHADQCADCRLAWLDALLIDGAVSQWRKSASARLPLVDLTDVVLYRKAAAQAETLAAGSEQRANPVAANEPIASTPGTRPLAGARVAAAVAATRQPRSLGRRIAALAAVGIAAAVCVAALAGRAGRQHDASRLVNQTSPSPLPKASTVTPISQIASPAPQVLISATKSPVKAVAEAPHETLAEDSGPDAFDQTIGNVPPATAASVSATHPGQGATTAAPTDDDRWVDDVGRQFEPMGSNLSQAFHFLWEAVPAKKAPSI